MNLIPFNKNKPDCPITCPLYDRPLVESEVTDTPVIWIVGEAPGYEEVRFGRPFVGRAGKLLRKTLRDLNFNVPMIITNACLCHPEKNKTPSKKAIEACKWHFKKLTKPQLIIALGIPAVRSLGIPVKKLEDIRGKTFQTEYGPCIVTYHPARILRSEFKLKHVFVFDLKKALAILKGYSSQKVDLEDSVTILDKEDDIIDFLSSVPNDQPVAIDIETAFPDQNGQWPEWGLNPFHPYYGIYTMSIAFNNQAWSFPVDIKYPEDKKSLLKGNVENIKSALKGFFQTHHNLIAHNVKFEYKAIKSQLNIIPYFKADTQLMAYITRENMQGFYSLESLSSMYNIDANFKSLKYKDLLVYNAVDALVTLKLYYILQSEIANLNERVHLQKIHNFLLHEVTPLLVELEENGVLIKQDELSKIAKNLVKVISKVKTNLKTLTGITNPKSKDFKQYFKSLCDENGIEIELTDTGLPSVRGASLKTVLNKTKDQKLKKVILYIQTYTKLSKINDTYIETYPKFINPITGRIHPSYKHTGTETGRLSCQEPNLQQIPKGSITICPDCYILTEHNGCPICGKEGTEVVNVSKIFTAPPGFYLVSADYSQMEVRILAHLSGDENLINAIKRGLDLHSYTVSKIYGIPYEEVIAKKEEDPYIGSLRKKAKSVTFGIIYGITPVGLAKQLNIEVSEAQKLIDEFYRLYPQVERFFKEVEDFVKKNHYYVTPTSRVRHYELFDEKELREARNFPIQSTASDLALHSAGLLRKEFQKQGLPARLVGHIHDAIKIEALKSRLNEILHVTKKTMTEKIEKIYNLKVPLEVDFQIESGSEDNSLSVLDSIQAENMEYQSFLF